MNSNPKTPLLLNILKSLSVILGPIAGYWLAPDTKWELSALSIFLTVGLAFGVIVAWMIWSFEMYVKTSYREKIKHAKEMDRSICSCTERGEIMIDNRINDKNYTWCPKCSKSYPPLSDLKINF